MKQVSLSALAFVLSLFAGCKKATPETEIFNTWHVVSPQIEAELQVNTDSTFHVNLAFDSIIEAEGRVKVAAEEITFINEKGSDTAAANPYPGRYSYTIMGDTAWFTKIDDTLSRRSSLLALPWVKQ